MKISKQFLIAGAMLCAITTTGAHAVTKCVALNSSTECTSEDYNNHTDWAATCTTNGVITPISGIGICSDTSGSSIGQTATELSIMGDDEYCWCKMTSPAVSSRWVFYGSYVGVPAACARYCASDCANGVQSNASFRSRLFGSLSD